ncbi:hypothetical protein ElyMa_005870000 [Elysia marginata]|uniref:Uncharacterized protein n=1 Tax=Elysia marginata TaxID=1093978 RepID=A0AAV4G116_9GAST|nr:hypothetical protein ElyMa_005870000 [Elysia marginata]
MHCTARRTRGNVLLYYRASSPRLPRESSEHIRNGKPIVAGLVGLLAGWRAIKTRGYSRSFVRAPAPSLVRRVIFALSSSCWRDYLTNQSFFPSPVHSSILFCDPV